jgi:hypothetical protein
MENNTTLNQIDLLLGSTDACPSDLELAAYVDGMLSFPNRYKIERHLATCFECAEVVAGAKLALSQEIVEPPPQLFQKAQWEFGGGLIHFGDFVQDLLEKHPIAGKNIEQWFVDISMPDETSFKENLKEDMIAYILASHFCQEDEVDFDEELELRPADEIVNLALELSGFAIPLIAWLKEEEEQKGDFDSSKCEELSLRKNLVNNAMNDERIAIRHQEAIRRFLQPPYWNVQIEEIELENEYEYV